MKDKKEIKEALFLLLLFLFISVLWYLGGVFVDSFIDENEVATISAIRGQFGDKFGAINALFSGLAFAGIIATILLQKNELRLQRLALDKQIDLENNRQFESTFFKLLEVHNSILSSLDIVSHQGRRALDFYFRNLVSKQDFSAFISLQKINRSEVWNLKAAGRVIPGQHPQFVEEDVAKLNEYLKNRPSAIDNYLADDSAMHGLNIKNAYSEVFKSFQNELAHYFRNIYHTFLFVDQSTIIEASTKKKYLDVFRAQLTDIELVSLFYLGMQDQSLPGLKEIHEGKPRLGTLLLQYEILSNLDQKNLLHFSHWEIFVKNNSI